MEHCPLCGRDTACTNRVFGQLPIYNCIECWITWKPNRSDEWRPDDTGRYAGRTRWDWILGRTVAV